jgi:hypothetical protein
MNSSAPYPSRISLRYALPFEIYRQLYLLKGDTGILSRDFEFLKNIASELQIPDNLLEGDIRQVAQTQQKILDGVIKNQRELNAVQKHLTVIASASGLPILSIIGSTISITPFLLAAFFPFIFGLFGLFGVAVWAINDNIQKKKNFTRMRKKALDKEKESYLAAIDRISILFPELDEIVNILNQKLEKILE